ncbi:MAG TPA: aminotransferase class I/II-fold pyridoxal phosphate-dependent enzyme [Candidatus Saccharimonadales bacterium]|nr:aminotransferase class I/II-fold pyridoxal phosphate-dependent enzyme [Candidatus Saccharimonadales bacterium]
MKIKPFEIERYFARYEFSAPYLLSSSDCEPLSLQELLKLADKQSLKLWHNLSLGYTESQGNPILRKEVAKLYKNVKSDEILIGAPQELITIAMNVLLKTNDHVIVTYPGYQSLYEVANALGCYVTKWMLDENNDWNLNLEFLKKSINNNTKLIVVNFPHNPTGYLPTKKEFLAILKIAKEKNIPVFSDEMYRFLEYKQEDMLPGACEVYNNAISLFGMSKTFGLPGLRMGWLVIKNKGILQKCLEFKDYTTICPNAPSEILALMGLRAKDKIVKRNLGIINTNLKILDKFFQNNKLFTWNRPKAGSVCFPKYLGKQTTTKLCKGLVDKKGVMMLPSYVFGIDNKHVRIGFGRKNMPQVIKLLENYLRKTI